MLAVLRLFAVGMRNVRAVVPSVREWHVRLLRLQENDVVVVVVVVGGWQRGRRNGRVLARGGDGRSVSYWRWLRRRGWGR